MATELLGLDDDAIVIAEIKNRLAGKSPGEPIRIAATECPSLANWLRNHPGQRRGIVRREATYLAQLDSDDEIILERFPPIGHLAESHG